MRKNKSAILEAVHETAKGLHAAGVMDQVTLREFDRLCLPPVEPLSPSKIKNSGAVPCQPGGICGALEYRVFCKVSGSFWVILDRWEHASEYLEPQVFFVAQSVCTALDDANPVVPPTKRNTSVSRREVAMRKSCQICSCSQTPQTLIPCGFQAIHLLNLPT
jgi:hypothetical protein